MRGDPRNYECLWENMKIEEKKTDASVKSNIRDRLFSSAHSWLRLRFCEKFAFIFVKKMMQYINLFSCSLHKNLDGDI